MLLIFKRNSRSQQLESDCVVTATVASFVSTCWSEDNLFNNLGFQVQMGRRTSRPGGRLQNKPKPRPPELMTT